LFDLTIQFLDVDLAFKAAARGGHLEVLQWEIEKQSLPGNDCRLSVLSIDRLGGECRMWLKREQLIAAGANVQYCSTTEQHG
jgi:hypothetical protein